MNKDFGNKWRFPGNNYAAQNGLNTPDMETFKKDPIASLARETCQNSIDAKAKGKKKVVVEFSAFDIPRTAIPDIDGLTGEIESCMEFRKNKADMYAELVKMHDAIKADKITCLRISDSDTTGLLGVETEDINKAFYLLTKGSGVTDKVGTKGGSKGIGKFASFVASSFNTVFYSTKTEDGHEGYIGICKLCSSSIKDSDELTQGIGYFSKDFKNGPVLSPFNLDEGYLRTNPGTDIYILGFENEKGWEKEIITKILDSFMCAIVYDELEINVNGIIINSKTIETVLTAEYILPKMLPVVKAQYVLLTDKSVITEMVPIFAYGHMKLFLKSYKKEEASEATNNCIMIRYPYMKIKNFKDISSIPCSAMAIIQDDGLNEILRKIENPQHDDWQPKRADSSDERDELTQILKEMKKQIIDFVQKNLANTASTEADVEGAGDFLPENTEGDGSGKKEEEEPGEKPAVTKPNVVKVKDDSPNTPDEDANGLQPDIGEHTDDGDDSPDPKGENSSSGGGAHDSDDASGHKEDGDQEILTIVPLRNAKSRLMAIDKKHGKYAMTIDTLEADSNCEMKVYSLDDFNNKEFKKIVSCKVNGAEVTVEDGIPKHFALMAGKNKLEVVFDETDYFGCEVRLYAYR